MASLLFCRSKIGRPALVVQGGPVFHLVTAGSWSPGSIGDIDVEINGRHSWEAFAETLDGSRPPAIPGVYEPEGDIGTLKTAKLHARR